MTEVVASCVDKYNLPLYFSSTRWTGEATIFRLLLRHAKKPKRKAIIVQLPIGTEADFKGIVDILSGKAYLYDKDGKVTISDVPEDMVDDVQSARNHLWKTLQSLMMNF